MAAGGRVRGGGEGGAGGAGTAGWLCRHRNDGKEHANLRGLAGHTGAEHKPMSFLDYLAFGPGRDQRAWARAALVVIAVLAIAAGILYLTVSDDYAFLRASLYT